MVLGIVIVALLSISFFAVALLASRKIKAIKACKATGDVNRWDRQRLIMIVLGILVAVYGTFCLLVAAGISSLKKSCRADLFVPPEEYGKPIDGLWFYEGNSRMKSDGSSRQLLADKIDLDGEAYNLTLEDLRIDDRTIIKDGNMYFTQTIRLNNNQYVVALFSYCFETESYTQIYADISDYDGFYLIDVTGGSILIRSYEYGRSDVFYVFYSDGNIKTFKGFKYFSGKFLFDEYDKRANIVNWTKPDAESKLFEFDGANEISICGDADSLLVTGRFRDSIVKFYYHDGNDLKEIFTFSAAQEFSVQGCVSGYFQETHFSGGSTYYYGNGKVFADYPKGYLCEARFSDGCTKIYYYENGEMKEIFATENGFEIVKVTNDRYDIEENYYILHKNYQFSDITFAKECSVLRVKGGSAEVIYNFPKTSLDYTKAAYVDGYLNFYPERLKKYFDKYKIVDDKDVSLNLETLTLSKGLHKDESVDMIYENEDFSFWFEYKRKNIIGRKSSILMRKNKATGETEIMQYRDGYRNSDDAYNIIFIG